ncbi:TcaA NTF2-like domain-containing protein [Paenibacillus wulumuqiensis]|uniref:TcaA NTF2-like domain-containing protein n=1 Tax=Paenibacillus wulumuqiensis TaxID=1567107 RepID=UPI000619DA37|nr:zinc ribbon domain-containing protein [Paenibacillus wulumuqiensis]
MYCGHCGTRTEPDWVFCRECGHRLEPESAAASTTDTTAYSQPQPVREPIQLSPRTKRMLMIGGGALVLLLIAFFILRATNGPSTPEELAKQLTAAVEAGDVNGLVKHLDEPDSPLREEQRLALFTESLQTEDTKSSYVEQIDNALQSTEAHEDAGSAVVESVRTQIRNSLNQSYWMTLVPVDSWRGTRWMVHIEPVDVKAALVYMNETLTTSMAIGNLKADHDTIKDLWPAVYTYQGTISSAYADVPVTDKVEAFSVNQPAQATLDYTKMASLDLRLPQSEATVMLNDKPVTGDPSQYIQIQPAPQQSHITVKMTAQGKDITGEVTLNPAEQDTYDLNTVVQKPIAEQALDIVYDASTSLAEAINTSNAKALKSVNPDSGYYNHATWEMNDYFSGNRKYKLQKVVIDLDSVEIDKDSIELSATQVYKVTNEDGSVSDKNIDWTYDITQQPQKDNWWINAAYPSWSNAIGSKHTIEKSAS